MRALKITNTITRRDEKSLEKYLAEISRYDVLTPDEELNLFKQLKNGDRSALEKIVAHNLRFVVSVAKQYQNLGLWLGDLINEGNIGLIKAAQRFDETRGFKFISYAVWWIRQSILQAVNEKSRNIRIPLNLKSNTSKVNKKLIKFLQKEEREPTIEELSAMTDLPKKTVVKCLTTYKKSTSLDAPLWSDNETSLLNTLPDTHQAKPDYEVEVKESQKIEVRHLLNLVSDRQAQVISMFYGIGRRYPVTLEDIADYIGVSKERVRQIKDRGLLKLRLKAKKRAHAFSLN